jgi:sigma-B regulation protein RsbU (phosphoserine phosphatase)
MQVLVGLALIALAIPLAWRLINQHLLWSLRNKLILTYLLIGLAPVVLFVTLVTVSAYFAVGQFSIHLADSRMREELDEMSETNAARAGMMARIMRARDEDRLGPPPRRPQPGRARVGPPSSSSAPQSAAAPAASETEDQAAARELEEATTTSESPDTLQALLHPHTSIYVNGAPLPTLPGLPPAGTQQAAAARAPLGLPPWAADLHDEGFHGLVLDGEDLYLVAINQRWVEGSRLITVVTSLPVDGALMAVVAKGLGRVQVVGLRPGSSNAAPTTPLPASAVGSQRKTDSDRIGRESFRGTSVFGGAEPLPVTFYDFHIGFGSTLDTTDWETGQPPRDPAIITVQSRPSRLYRQLFGSSLGGFITRDIRLLLIALCIIFGIIEALALVMALGLSRAITSSVHELYRATQRVDRGDFVTRIAERSARQDQLAELARSFNGMTGSLERLLLEQQEKERLQSEISIAQEVQANLFPHHVRNLPGLELHGICRPARSVSGDYYDFLIFHGPDHPDGTRGSESGVGIALGDISGKGISAALLMATLHSAVRAYRLAGEELVYSEPSYAALTVNREGLAGDGGKLFESPGRILSLLNRHLYRSTQPEKYATLFLAHYDAAAAQLTYSNAGHLPPLVLSRDGKIRRLDVGGTVVGLMDGMRYQEDRFQMKSGDILVAYSDGITEPENDFGEFGEERLMEVVALYRDQPLHVISAQVMLALDAWIGAEEQPDDITLVLARQV